MLETELNFFIAHQDELVGKYLGKVLVIKGAEVVGVYDTPLKAYLSAKKEYAPGTFMVQPCIPGPDAYTVTVTSLSAS